ncbi:MAG: phenylalanine--tRNA ligase subunit alpha [Bacilli bacterium]
MEREKQIHKIKNELLEKLIKVENLNQLNDLKSEYTGKKSFLNDLKTEIKNTPNEKKSEFGKMINEVKNEFENIFLSKKTEIENKILETKLLSEKVDVTLPGFSSKTGSIHPLNLVIEEVIDIFIRMGYSASFGPEVEEEFYNFEALNVGKDHPARDMQDSFYTEDNKVLRTHTSPVQIRTMIENEDKNSIRIICPGKVYRRDDDATHSHQFMQIEGLVVDENISIANLKGTLELMLKELFGNDRIVRFRPSYFPFTEPSIEIDISCHKCKIKGCNLCKNTGYIEVMGAGMVHPNVLKNCGYDNEKYSGFAFGIGVDRIAMLKYGINDIRELYSNDIRFLQNFGRKRGGN